MPTIIIKKKIYHKFDFIAYRFVMTHPIYGLDSGFSCQHLRIILFTFYYNVYGILGRVFYFSNLALI